MCVSCILRKFHKFSNTSKSVYILESRFGLNIIFMDDPMKYIKSFKVHDQNIKVYF